jgi:phosphate transport system protein
MVEADSHTLKAFDKDLAELRGLVAEMGRLAEVATKESVGALVHGNSTSAATVVHDDRRIDELESVVEQQVIRLIALRSPVADDLRQVVAAHKIAHALERIGDYAKNIAKRVPTIQASGRIEPVSILPVMGRAAAEMVNQALDAFTRLDIEAAALVCQRDREIDEFYNSLFRTLLTYMMENPHTISVCTHLLFIAKNLERIGDLATTIGEMTHFAVTGEKMNERPRGADLLAEPAASS